MRMMALDDHDNDNDIKCCIHVNMMKNNDSGDGVAVAAAVDKMTASTLLPSVQIYLDGSPVDVSSSVVSVAELRNALHEPLSANQLRVRIEVR